MIGEHCTYKKNIIPCILKLIFKHPIDLWIDLTGNLAFSGFDHWVHLFSGLVPNFFFFFEKNISDCVNKCMEFNFMELLEQNRQGIDKDDYNSFVVLPR
jgi:hypothetical protein